MKRAETNAQERAITVRWNFDKPRASPIQGVLGKRWRERAWHGVERRYLIRGKNRDYVLPGTAQLDALMARVRPGKLVRVTHRGFTEVSGGRQLEMMLEVDDGR